MTDENIIRNIDVADDGILDNSIRPEVIDEYIGQTDVKENIKDNIKNSITLIINITTSPTIFRKIQVAKPHLFIIISYVS